MECEVAQLRSQKNDAQHEVKSLQVKIDEATTALKSFEQENEAIKLQTQAHTVELEDAKKKLTSQVCSRCDACY